MAYQVSCFGSGFQSSLESSQKESLALGYSSRRGANYPGSPGSFLEPHFDAFRLCRLDPHKELDRSRFPKSLVQSFPS